MQVFSFARRLRGVAVVAACLWLVSGVLHASNVKTWNGPAGGNWSVAANWQDGGAASATVPGSTDNVFFDNTTNNNCTVDGSFTCLSLNVSVQYTGTISLASAGALNVTNNVTINSGTLDATTSTQAVPLLLASNQGVLVVNGGTINAGSKKFIVGGSQNVAFQLNGGTINAQNTTVTILLSYAQSGGTFNASSTNTQCFQGWNLTAGTFVHNNGLLTLGNGTNVISSFGAGGKTVLYNNVQLTGGSQISLTSDMNVVGTFTTFNQFNSGGNNASIAGATNISGLYNTSAGTGTTTFKGDVTIQAGGTLACDVGTVNVGNITIAGSAAAANQVGHLSQGSGILNVAGNWSRPVSTFNGTFASNNSNGAIVNFTSSGLQTLDYGSSGQDFYDLAHTGTGTLTLINTKLNFLHSLTQSGGTLDAGTAGFSANTGQFIVNDTPTATSVVTTATVCTAANGIVMSGGSIQATGNGSYVTSSVTASSPAASVLPQSVIGAPITLSGAGLFSVNGDLSVLTVSNTISIGNGGLTKDGAGTLRLIGNNSFNGSTVSNGKLQVDGTFGTVSVSGGILSGIGTVGNTFVGNAGAVRPGDAGVGKLTVSGTFNLQSGATMIVNVTDTTHFGQLAATGQITLAGALELSSPGAFISIPTTRLTILDNQSGVAINGTFASAPEGTVEPLNGQNFTVTYVGAVNGKSVLLKAPNVAPIFSAAPTATPSSAKTGDSVQFSATATDANGDTLTYTWDFGDSTAGTGATPTHAYAMSGIFTAKCTVSDGVVGTTASVVVTITSGNLAIRAFAGTPPNAVEGSGSSARFNAPQGTAVDSAGNIYVSDTRNHVIRKLTPAGVSSTVAGRAGVSGKADGASDAARFNGPQGLAIDSSGVLYVADTANHSIRRIATDGTVTTLGGLSGTSGFVNSATGSAARFNFPYGICIAPSGNVYVADSNNHSIRMITTGGVVTTLTGTGASGSTNGALGAASFNFPEGLIVDSTSSFMYVADTSNHVIRKIDLNGSSVSTLAGKVSTTGFVNDPAGANVRLRFPQSLVFDPQGNLIVADASNRDLRNINVSTGGSATFAGGAVGFADGQGTAATLGLQTGLSTDSSGTIFAGDITNSIVRKISSTAAVGTLAGSATAWDVDGLPAKTFFPGHLCVDNSGTVYYVDFGFSTVRKIAPDGTATTLAGVFGVSGSNDDPVGTNAKFNRPAGIALDAQGNLFIADSGNHTIRKITPGGSVTTFAGTAGVSGHADLQGINATFFTPYALAFDENGVLYVAESGNNTIRKIDANGNTTTLAGTALASGFVDNTGANARFATPQGITYAGNGLLYVSDTGNGSIRSVTTSTGVTVTVAGTGLPGYKDGAGNIAQFNNPVGITVDGSGNIFVCESLNYTVRKITPQGNVLTILGTAGVFGCQDGNGPAGQINQPFGLTFGNGKFYIADASNNAIRILQPIGTDTAAIDLATSPAQHVRNLSVSQTTGTRFSWIVQRRPVGSTVTLTAPATAAPTFIPDVPGVYTFQLTASNPTTASVTTVDFTATASSNTPPSVTSNANALPNPALVNQTITFTGSATDAEGDALTYTWDFGDGTSGSGASVTHSYGTSGSFTAALTVSDGIAPAVAAGTVLVTVNIPAFPPPIIGSGVDSDGDGFSDSFEMAVGTDPNSAVNSPTGGAITAGSIQSLTLTKPSIKLNFKTMGTDSIVFSGPIAIPKGFVANGTKIYSDVSGVTKVLTLTAKGNVKSGNDSAKLTYKTVKGAIAAQTGKFTLTFTKGKFASTLTAAGLTPASAKNSKVFVVFTLIFNGSVYQTTQPMFYTAKMGISGSAK